MSQLDVEYENECMDMQILPADRRFADALSLYSDRVSILEYKVGVMIVMATFLGIATPITSFATCIEGYSCGVTCLNQSLMISTYDSFIAKAALSLLARVWFATWCQVLQMCLLVQHWSTRWNLVLMQLRYTASIVLVWIMWIVFGSICILLIRFTSWEARVAFEKYKESW